MVFFECTRVLLVLINIILLVFGIVFKLCWDALREYFNYDVWKIDLDLERSGVTVLTHTDTVFGGVLVFVSLVGCTGACLGVTSLPKVFVVATILLVIAESLGLGLLVTHTEASREKKMTSLQISLQSYQARRGNEGESGGKLALLTSYDSNLTSGKAWVPIHTSGGREASRHPLVTPITFCRDLDYGEYPIVENFQRPCPVSDDTYVARIEGCIAAISHEAKQYKDVLLGVGLFLLSLQGAAVILSLYLCTRKDEAEKAKVQK